MRNKTIYDEMDIHSYDTSNHVVCMCALGWRSQQKVSGEETRKGVETCLPDDFNSFFWHPCWCYGKCKGHTESLLVVSGMSTELVLFGKQKAMLMFAMRQARMAVRYGTFKICVLRTSHVEPYRTSVQFLKRTVPMYRTRTITKKRTVLLSKN